jgi:polyhydroxyalkanoate synthesis regulator phasin
MSATSSTVDKIMGYEQGDLNAKEATDLFSDLVRTGLAWQLQGHGKILRYPEDV